jgi:hypothetical protein
MHNTYIKLLLLTILGILFSLQGTTAQSCRGYDKKCDSAPKHFEASSLSRSITMRKARKTVINQTFYGNREYFISVCGKKRLGKIHFRLIADDESQTVLYDNAIENFLETQLFVIQNTMKVKIELSAPHYFDDQNAECAGVQVYYNRNDN